MPDLRTANDGWRWPPTTTAAALLNDAGGDSDFRRMIYDIFTMSVNFDRI